VAAVAGVAEGFKYRQMVWRGQWRRPQQLGGQIEQLPAALGVMLLHQSASPITAPFNTSGQAVSSHDA